MKRALLIATVVAVAMFGVVAYAMAANPESVAVTAFANPKITMTVSTTTVDFGNVDPGVAQATKDVTLNVDSNKDFTVTKNKTADAAMGLTTSLGLSTAGTKGAGNAFTDTYGLTLPWSVSASSTANTTIVYTAAQN